ncbi:cytochrome P450 71AU50-like [Salvia splendens]|uniref:cytochrome P450 71AU50-like n=1 Tax=Salvia splendens TaxID=180675 RepID=UPI001C27B965|nr:cytochrome P450 71AU50-like [Salvia splendens]
MALIWTVLIALVVAYAIKAFLRPKSKKKSPPGPRGLPILGHFHLLGSSPHRDLLNLARKHGPIMGIRFGFVPTVVITSPSAAALILKSHDHVFASRPKNDAARYIGYDQKNLVTGPYGPYWRNMRKLCTSELLSSHRITHFQPMRNAEIALMMGGLRQANKAVDLSARISTLSGDMNCLMVFGRKYSDLEEIGFKSVISETMELAARFNLADYFPYVGALDLQGINRRLKHLSKVFDGIVEKILLSHVEKQKDKDDEDFVDTMMSILRSGSAGFEFGRTHVKAILLDLLIAGTDTSSTAIEWTMSELMRHPTVMKKLQKEIEAVVGLDGMVNESHLDKLEYLYMVLKETLRLHPVAPLLIPHESMEDCEVDGYHIPKKSQIIVNAWAIMRDPNIWPDPDTFKPERFLERDIDMRGQDFRLIPFGSGRRGCPGMLLALTVVRLVVAQLVHCFDWELPDEMAPDDLDMSEHFGIVTNRAKPLMAIPRYRLRI